MIIHHSVILAEGLYKLLQNSSLQLHDHLRIYSDPQSISLQSSTNYVFVASPFAFHKLYNQHLISLPESNYRFLQLITDTQTQKESLAFDSIHLDDTHHKIVEKIRSAINSFNHEKIPLLASLTDRETEILKLVSLGNANKEIADKLNISTHTVVTHRKNITEKLGIKSISGLTVYAILNKIIDTDELSIDDLI
jgi:DNA-binding CsgD family transcriptional regulator